ncbi:MAG: type II toxin-antitoxin system PemK/MazF family toxin [Chloroflexi bacterium]|nr:type II toxin-antitoxin system PemK/MazF family toxin [Chloroflexota bacterium]
MPYPPPPTRSRGPHMVLLLSWDAHLTFRDRLMVADVTSHIRGVDAEVFLDESDGLSRPCVVNLDSLANVFRTELIGRVTHLGEAKMLAVERAVHRALGMILPCRVV